MLPLSSGGGGGCGLVYGINIQQSNKKKCKTQIHMCEGRTSCNKMMETSHCEGPRSHQQENPSLYNVDPEEGKQDARRGRLTSSALRKFLSNTLDSLPGLTYKTVQVPLSVMALGLWVPCAKRSPHCGPQILQSYSEYKHPHRGHVTLPIIKPWHAAAPVQEPSVGSDLQAPCAQVMRTSGALLSCDK